MRCSKYFIPTSLLQPPSFAIINSIVIVIVVAVAIVIVIIILLMTPMRTNIYLVQQLPFSISPLTSHLPLTHTKIIKFHSYEAKLGSECSGQNLVGSII